MNFLRAGEGPTSARPDLTEPPPRVSISQTKTMVNAPEPERKRKPKEPPVDAAKLAKKLQNIADNDGKENKPGKSKPGRKKLVKKSEMIVATDDAAPDTDDDMDDVPIGRAFALPAPKPKPAKEGKMREKTVKERKLSEKGKQPGRKATAMGKAANIAAAGLKRPAKQFEIDEEPSSRGSKKVPAGGRPAKRQARAALEDRFAAVKTPKSSRSPNVLDDTDVVATRWPSMANLTDSGDVSPLNDDFFAEKPKGKSKKGASKGADGKPISRFAQMAKAAEAAAEHAKSVIGARGERLPAGKPDGAWSSAYRTLQAAHVKLQTKYEKLKETKLADMVGVAEQYQSEIAEHGTKAEELINHFRAETDRYRELAANAEAMQERVFELERESSELKETLLAYQGKILRMEQDAAADADRRGAEVDAESSGRFWGSEELEAFTGLRWEKQETGVHRFTHAATGFCFQLAAAEPEEDEEDAATPVGGGGGDRRRSEVMAARMGEPAAEDVAYEPIHFGDAEGYLPGYLAEAIEFERGEMPEFVGRMLGVLNQVAAERARGR